MYIDFVFALRKILHYMEENFRKDIHVSDISEAVGYSPRYCNSLFKKYFGETIADHLRILRMNAAKDDLKNGHSVESVAQSLSYHSLSAFRAAFRNHFGVTPSHYAETGECFQKYQKTYEWNDDASWGDGKNPTSDGLWEFTYFDPQTEQYHLMEWENDLVFTAPYDDPVEQDDRWYCFNRFYGFSIHSSRAYHAVKSFICPHGGRVEVFFSVGRQYKIRKRSSPCRLRFLLNGAPLSNPESNVLLDTINATYLTATLDVKPGDRISLILDSLGNNHQDGVMLYRQKIGYLTVES